MVLNFSTCFIIVLITYIIILISFIHFSHKKDFLNNLFAFSALLFVYINMLLILLLMVQDTIFKRELIPMWCDTLVIPIIFIGVLILISTVMLFFSKKKNGNKMIKKFADDWNKKKELMSKAKRDTCRKIPHILIFIGLFILWYVGYLYIFFTQEDTSGMIPFENNMLKLYIQLLSEPDSVREVLSALGWFYYLIFFFFYIMCLFLLANEFTRKTKYFCFPLNCVNELILTEEEKQGYGTYLHFSIGQMFAALLCPPMVFFAILGMSAIGDLMTSQVGIRWGKTHIKWNKKKTWEGTIAGTITSFFICFLFMGLIWAFIFSMSFMIFDLITSKPLNLSDNLLIPIGSAFIFVFLRFFFNMEHQIIFLF